MDNRFVESAKSAQLSAKRKPLCAKKQFIKLAKKLSGEGEISNESLDGLVFLIEAYFDDSYNNFLEQDYEF